MKPFLRAAWIVALACRALAGPASDPFDVAVGLRPDGAAGGVLSVTLRVPPQHYVYADQVQIQADGVAFVPRDVPTPAKKHDPFTDEERSIYGTNATFRYGFQWGGQTALLVRVQYQGCSEEMCFLPATRAVVVARDGAVRASTPASGAPGAAAAPTPASGTWRSLAQRFDVADQQAGYLRAPEFGAFLDRGLGGAPRPRPAARGLLVSMVLILLGGLALNLTPCVLPMIPINLAIIGAGAQAGSRARGFGMGALYGAGMALAYGALGVIVILTGAQFGELNSSPWFNLGVALLFLFLALATFGVFSVDLSRFQSGGPRRRAGAAQYVAVFVMGGVAALLAGACVAPALIFALVLAADLYARGQVLGLLLPFLLGLGMASVWPLAGAGLSFLPKPGKWMERVKVVFGVLICVFSIYYGLEAYRLFVARTPASRAAVLAVQEQSVAEGWGTSLDQALAAAWQARKPVLIDFWATWCKSCIAMEKTTFQNPDVQQKLKGFIRVKYQAEFPGEDPAREVLAYYGARGLPTYVILVPRPKAAGPGGP